MKFHIRQVGSNIFASLDNKFYTKMDPTGEDGEWYCELLHNPNPTRPKTFDVFFHPDGTSFVQSLRYPFDMNGKRHGRWENIQAEFILHLTPSA